MKWFALYEYFHQFLVMYPFARERQSDDTKLSLCVMYFAALYYLFTSNIFIHRFHYTHNTNIMQHSLFMQMTSTLAKIYKALHFVMEIIPLLKQIEHSYTFNKNKIFLNWARTQLKYFFRSRSLITMHHKIKSKKKNKYSPIKKLLLMNKNKSKIDDNKLQLIKLKKKCLNKVFFFQIMRWIQRK